MFLKIMHEKLKKAQNDETQENKSLKNEKKSINDIF